MDTVRVETGSRLHFGPLSWRSDGPDFGGIGLMIDEPRTVVTASVADEFSIEIPERFRIAPDRFEPLFARWGSASEIKARLCLEDAAPAHKGFGSGTQLACAAAYAFATLADLELSAGNPDGDPADVRDAAVRLASLTGRGARSAIGLHGFLSGGFLVDAGRSDAEIGTLVSRCPVPESWEILLDVGHGEGVAGELEADAFRRLPAMPTELTGRLCDLVLRSIVPGLIENDFEVFSNALTEYGQIAGHFFQSIQGGAFADPAWHERLERLRDFGPVAVAQSSWGPTVAVICEDSNAADAVREAASEVTWVSARARNHGAVCQTW